MDSIKDTLADMMEMFQKRMAEFDAELHKTPSPSSTTSNLAVDFASFRSFITEALGNLQQQVQILARNVDSVEMRGRRKILLLHGVKEVNKENTAVLVSNVIKDHLKLSDFSPQSIKRCHRMGRATDTQKPRPILFKLQDVLVRDKLWYAKTKLKGSGITMSEFLTKVRHDVFMSARERFGVARCWTQEGCVYVAGPDGARIRVHSLQDLNNIEGMEGAKPAARTRITKSKRTVNNKK